MLYTRLHCFIGYALNESSINFYSDSMCKGSQAAGKFADEHKKKKINVVVGVPCDEGMLLE